jgi:BirA family biotin operon repressor/biotin-[acetyl-CoA-carboxylase] ligase
LTSNRSEIVAAVARARARLGPLATRVEHWVSIGSTNDAAAALGGEGTVVVADAQTAGRGRRGRSWFSPPGSGLYVSVVLAPSRARTDRMRATSLLTLAAGVAIAEGVRAAADLDAALKWPNDIYVGRRKLAGILAESHGEVVIVGYGINVAAGVYPADLADRVTSIESEIGRPVDRTVVLVETLAALAARYDDLLEGRFDAILDAWRSRAPTAVGTRVEWTTPEGPRWGITDGIDPDGALRVRTPIGTDRLVGGELRWLYASSD